MTRSRGSRDHDQNIRLINTESLEEIKLLEKIAKEKNKSVNIGVRLNPNIDGNTLNKISTGKKTDKFGIDIEDIESIISIVKNYINFDKSKLELEKILDDDNSDEELKKMAEFELSGLKAEHEKN